MFSKSLENLERIRRLVSLKPPMCHNTDTMRHTENRIPRYKPQTTTKSIPKFSALTLKRSSQDTGYGERMQVKLKALILVLGLLQVVGTVKKLKALILVLGLLQVVGTVMTGFSFTCMHA